MKHAFTRTWPARGLGFVVSPMYKFSIGPLSFLINTARMVAIFGMEQSEEASNQCGPILSYL